jgi:hypothetical protein
LENVMNKPIRIVDLDAARAVLRSPDATDAECLRACEDLDVSHNWMDIRTVSEVRNAIWAKGGPKPVDYVVRDVATAIKTGTIVAGLLLFLIGFTVGIATALAVVLL